jgi:hypothetical protein
MISLVRLAGVQTFKETFGEDHARNHHVGNISDRGAA